jgi:tetratricopeptide (TPR) repeat protein
LLLLETPGRLLVLLNHLAQALLPRFKRYRNDLDFSEGIETYQQAVKISPFDHHLPLLFINLAETPGSRYDRYGEPIDLAEGIKAVQEATLVTPDSSHPNFGILLDYYTTFLEARIELYELQPDIDELADIHRHIAEILLGRKDDAKAESNQTTGSVAEDQTRADDRTPAANSIASLVPHRR